MAVDKATASRKKPAKHSRQRALPAPKTGKRKPAAAPPPPEVVSAEVYEILNLAQSGTPLDARRLFSAMVQDHYRYPHHASVIGGRQAQYEDVASAFAACERHVAEAVRVTARLRSGSEGVGAGLQQVTDAYHRMVEIAVRKLAVESGQANARDFAALLTATQAALKDASSFFGKPVETNVVVNGKITHLGLTSDAAGAYSAWHGGTDDLAGVTDAEFMEVS